VIHVQIFKNLNLNLNLKIQIQIDVDIDHMVTVTHKTGETYVYIVRWIVVCAGNKGHSAGTVAIYHVAWELTCTNIAIVQTIRRRRRRIRSHMYLVGVLG